MSKLSLDIIELLNLVKETGSFSTAAEKLNRTPSAISYRASNIEKQLGLKLFNRKGPIVALSKSGEAIVSEGAWILKAIDNLECRLSIDKNKHHILTIGVSHLISLSNLSEHLNAFLEKCSGFKINIVEYADSREWEALSRGELDIIFSGYPAPENVKALSFLISIDKVVCCATPEYKKCLENKDEQVASELKACTMISNNKTYEAEILSYPSLKSYNRVFVDDLSAQIELIKNGCGAGIVPLTSVKDLLNKDELEVIVQEKRLGFNMIWAGWMDNESRHTKWWRTYLSEVSSRLSR